MSTIPIITPPPKKDPNPKPQGQAAATSTVATLKPTGFNRFKDVIKHYSTWLWGLVAVLPQFYSDILLLGPVPSRFSDILWGTAAFGIASKFIKQQKVEQQ